MLMLKVICVLKKGGAFRRADVFNLKQQVDQNLKIPHRFICYSDVETPWTVPLDLGLRGWWSKVEIFRESGPCLYLDLDTALFQDLSELGRKIEETPGLFAMLRPIRKRRQKRFGFTSGVMAWNGDFSFLFSGFQMPDYRQDQRYFVEAAQAAGIRIEYVNNLLPPRAIRSYKRHVRPRGILPEMMICCFHGHPRPWQVGEPFYHVELRK